MRLFSLSRNNNKKKKNSKPFTEKGEELELLYETNVFSISTSPILRSVRYILSKLFVAVTKSGTGTWDLGRGDSGTWGLGDVGTWGRGDVGTRGNGEAGTRGRGDVGTWGRGDSGTWGRGDSGTWGRGDTFSKYRISEMGQHRQES